MYYIGVDIQSRRDCSFAVLDKQAALIESGWLSMAENEAIELIKKWSKSGRVYVGIDAPRMPLAQKRQWFWSGGKRRWGRRITQKGYGRHCEIVISAHGIANPQWTPLVGESPEWMNLGFKLFSDLESIAPVYEVFPSASYSLLRGNTEVRINADFSACKPGPKDMIDAMVAAVTVREFVEGRGTEVGGGDGLGTIILPRPIPEPVIDEVLFWPSDSIQ